MKMKFDPHTYHYPSRRNVIYGKKGMVASCSPLASQAGLEIIKKGGNAIDAIIATAAALTVVEPGSNGIGGDAFTILTYKGEMFALNSSGFAPELISLEKIKEKGYETEMPRYGLDPVTVPGVPAAWAALSKKFGRLPLSEVLEPAALLAEEGYPVSSTVAMAWERTFTIYNEQKEKYPLLQTWYDTFAPMNKPLKAGELFSSPYHANTLREIGATEAESFYRGALADKISDFSQKNGGYLRKSDLEKFAPEWITPLSTNYRGYDIWELPPNTHGIVALMGLNILEQFELQEKDSVETYHKQIEAVKLAFIDGLAHIADPVAMKVSVEELLSKEYAKKRSQEIQEQALQPEPGKLESSGTVYLAAADEEGNMISYIQSNYTGFGSGVVVPETGISLHNRGAQFSLDEQHPNVLAPGKKPYHTIIPGFITKDGSGIGSFGVMGGPLQPQAHVQVISSLIDFNFNPQDALDAPRWQWVSERTVQVEQSMPQYIIDGLLRKGHLVEISPQTGIFGRGQIIIKQENGVYIGGTEKRADGYIAVW